MSRARPATYGSDLAQQLFEAIRAAERAPLPGTRDLPILPGLDRGGGFVLPQENVLLQAIEILVASGRIYTYGDNVVMETQYLSSGENRLVYLRTGDRVETGAEDWLANLFVCEIQLKTGDIQIAPPRSIVDQLLRAEPLRSRLPRIAMYAQKPVFDDNFVLRGPGWHADCGILVHGVELEPVLFVPPPRSGSAIDRLPHHLRMALRGFCFRSDADVVNVVGLLLTGLLINLFIETGKALGLFDGNQRGVGKTLLVRVMSMILDGVDLRLMHYTADEEELQKRICANLRGGCRSVLLIDNAKVVGGGSVSSPVIEANSMAPVISLRILGASENFTRPNDLLWAITMNDTRTSPDLVSRGVPVQLYWEGDPDHRQFADSNTDPLEYARAHRLDILGELAGMVIHWSQAGRPEGSRPHRCRRWAQVVGGILEAAGFSEFLGNVQTAAAAFSSELDELAALAEAVIAGNGPFEVIEGDSGREV